MNYITMSFIAFIAGIAIAIQASINAQLGGILKNPLFATIVAFLSGLIFTLIAATMSVKEVPDFATIRSVPVYLWFSGGLLSAFAISTLYWLLPQIGIGTGVSYFLTGQLILAMIASHFGWFQTPVSPITSYKLVGVALLIFGIIIINNQT